MTQAGVGSSYTAKSFSDTPNPVVWGRERYYEIQFGHRLAYVRASDVDVVSSSSTAAGARERRGRPAEPVSPAEPAAPVAPVAPVDPAGPEEPAEPDEPDEQGRAG
ncbi:hypothetical protein LT493_01795 [Streptomyces tricolor]|nr:hypothetical protein [Streptomyces tricolor]